MSALGIEKRRANRPQLQAPNNANTKLSVFCCSARIRPEIYTTVRALKASRRVHAMHAGPLARTKIV